MCGLVWWAAVVTDAVEVLAWSDVVTVALVLAPVIFAGWFVVFPVVDAGGLMELAAGVPVTVVVVRFPLLTEEVVAFPSVDVVVVVVVE